MKDIRDLAYGVTIEGANEVNYDELPLTYGMTVEDMINTEGFQEAFEDFKVFLNGAIKQIKESSNK